MDMRITQLLKKESIELSVALDSKEAAIDKLTGLMEKGGRLHDRAGYKEGILAREAQGSTAVGDGIAIPHAKVAAVKEPGLAAVTVPEGVDYDPGKPDLYDRGSRGGSGCPSGSPGQVVHPSYGAGI